MKRKNITAALLVMCLFVLAGYAHRAYLEKVFIKKYKVEGVSTVSSESGDVAQLQKKIESLESKNKVLQGLNKDKNRQIAQLQSRLGHADKFFEVAGENGMAFANGISTPETINFENSTRVEMAEKLKEFAKHISQYMDEEQAEAFLVAMNEYIEDLSVDVEAVPVHERKDNLLSKLQKEMEETDSERRKQFLQKRIDVINNASEEDLPGVLAYFQRLDDISELNSLMREFKIGRDELIEAGIDPPPRTGLDPLEMSINLESFAEAYAPLLPQEQQEGFTENISEYLDNLTSWKNKSELQAYQSEWYNKTQKSYEKSLASIQSNTSMSEEKLAKRIEDLDKYYEKQLNQIENASDSRLRQMLQYDQMGEIRNLLREYDIPTSDLRQYGVITYGYHGHWGRGRH